MSNRLDSLLSHWLNSKDQHQWVLATIIETDGSSYRKAGAMMMVNDLGRYYGLLSGGCLESDIMLQAQRCWQNGFNRIVEYDMRQEEDIAWQLGIGCGGMVKILLQPVSAENQYLGLQLLYSKLQKNQPCSYSQNLVSDLPDNAVIDLGSAAASADLFVQNIFPAPHLAVFGGGVDARPLVAMASELGWQISLVDARSSYARKEYFPGATRIERKPAGELEAEAWLSTVDAVLILTHNVQMDADALALSLKSSSKYLGLLGPEHRTERVLEAARLTRNDLTIPLANPVGLRLGAELPETIALSMLAEVQAFLSGADAKSISGCL